jgi:retron-type reverse transcriptase
VRFFDSIVKSALIEMIEKRVTDGRVLRLIGKWIKVGVIEDGTLLVSETGTGQGQPISRLLANVYLTLSRNPYRPGRDIIEQVVAQCTISAQSSAKGRV